MASKIPVPADLPQLAAQTTPEHPWPLRLLSAKIREYVAAMSRLWVEGEVITLQRRPGAKVQFLSLRDLEVKVSITVKILTHLLPDSIEPGSRVVVCAKPDFYEGNGSLSLWADEIRPVGLGDILARLERLKAQLMAEGLFDASRKKPLPFLPACIGLICGRNTKAKEDVVVNSRLRWPAVCFDIREVQVQGQGAVDAMVGSPRRSRRRTSGRGYCARPRWRLSRRLTSFLR
ncbi:exodeoxyribonuclease VII large subunit [Actinobaculum sp. 313]|uniref:exodeoxyribonuclease VII large subunit n=1 Tax=Actinobaculum sp. 313 TaxID=2495645 RepID=UPI0023E828AB|nr:exodeoxyribonuclease VII large subunit [Actinobaculum sp. 313]